MKYAVWPIIIGASILLSNCSGTVSTRAARKQISALGGSTLIPSAIRIERVMAQAGDKAIAETSVKIAFQFEKDNNGDWRIVSARLGDRNWVDVDTLLKVLEEQGP